MTTARVADILPLTPTQQGMLFHSLYDTSGPDLYAFQIVLRLDGPLDANQLRAAGQALLDRHDALRAGFVHEAVREPVQVIAAGVPLPWAEHDLRELDADTREAAIRRVLAEDRARRFDLARPPLLRLTLVRCSGGHHVVVLTNHHLLYDGWSLAILLRELFRLYAGEQAAQLPRLAPYREYFAWLGRQDAAAARDAWSEVVSDLEPTLLAPAARPGAVPEVREHELTLDEPATEALTRLARSAGVTLGTVCRGSWGILLARLTGRTDVVFGTTSADRPADLTGSADMVGLFITTLPTRIRAAPAATAPELFADLQRAQAELLPHQHLGLPEIHRLAGHRDLFDTLVVFQNYPLDEAGLTAGSGLRLRSLAGQTSTHYPMSLTVFPGRRLRLQAKYRTDHFTGTEAETLLARWARLLGSLGADPDVPLARHDLLLPGEREQALEKVNDTGEPRPRPSVPELFARAARERPEHAALVTGGRTTTYGELASEVDALAAQLIRDHGAGPETVVAVLMPRSPEFVTAVLAVLRAGAAYLPLDPAYPRRRLAHMLGDAGARVLLTTGEAEVPETGVPVVVPGRPAPAAAPGGGFRPPHPDHAALLIYTSGTTGVPKAAVLTHGALANRLRGMQEEDPLTPADRVLHKAALGFDAAAWEILWPLTHGATVVPAEPGDERDPVRLAETIERESVTVSHFVPSMLREFLDSVGGGRCPSLRRVLCGGEVLSATLRDQLFEKLDVALHNRYGPTETTIHATHHAVDRTERAVPIGTPVRAMRAFVLDEYLQPVPPGTTGELHLAGPQLARGYHNHPTLTATHFTANPYGPPGTRMYRTGDLVHQDHHGHLHFHSRTDTQTKLRGHRIDPTEIDTTLTTHPHITTTHTTLRTDNPHNPQLTTYLTTTQPVDTRELRRYAADRLPAHLVPSAFVVLDSVPLSPNGKLDVAALPAPTPAEPGRPARTFQEDILTGLFAEVLGLPRVGVDDDFFELGGHSLLATRLVSRVRSVFGAEVPVRALFEAPTVAAFGRVLTGAGPSRARLTPRPRPEVLPLSFAQQRLWFLNRMDNATPAYNVSFSLRLLGPLEAGTIEAALNDLVARHESLRTVFPEVDGEPRQRVLSASEVRSVLTLDAVAGSELAAYTAERSQYSFDLTGEVPFRAHLAALGPEEHVLLLVFHHIASDGWSMTPLLRDLATAYRARRDGSAPGWAPLPVQYADYTLWHRELLGDPAVPGTLGAAQLDFWRETLAGLPATLRLPFDRPRPAVTSGRGGVAGFRFDAALHAGMVDLARTSGASLFMVVQASLAALLTKLGAGTDIPIGAPVAGRTDDALDDLVGFFVNTLVLRTDTSGDPSPRRLLARVRTTDLAAFSHQDLPFEQLVAALNPERSLAWHPLFQVILTLDNTPDAELDLDGLRTTMAPALADVAKFDLSVHLVEEHDSAVPAGIAGMMEFNADVFDRATAETIVTRWQRLLTSMLADPDRPLSRHDVLSPGERRQLLVEANDNATEVPAVTVVDLFERQAAATPDRPAIVTAAGETVAYRTLAARANRLARHLTGAYGAGPGTVVALALRHSAEVLVAVFAVLKTGAAYLPLDPESPAARVRHMIEDARPHLVVSAGDVRLPDTGVAVLRLDDAAAAAEVAARSDAPLAVPIHRESLAYLIFTSGTTGRPKAAAITHRGLTTYLHWCGRRYPSLAVAAPLYSSLAFDLTVTSLFGPLVAGGSVYVADVLHGEAVSAAGPRFLKATPSHLPLLIEHGDAWPVTGELVLGGEPLRGAELDRWRAGNPGATVVNEYGPTETTVGCMEYRIPPGAPVDRGVLTLGRLADNVQGYVLDQYLQPVPPGTTGELHLAGPQLARGYHNHPTLTATHFTANPYGPPGTRMYRTGDLVHQDHHGHLHFHSRTDTQTKLRGHRIDPTEIDTTLTTHPHITTTHTTLRTDNPHNPQLTTYLTTTQPVDTRELRALLAESLPDYLVPTHLVVLPRMPLTPTGKIDVAALPAPAAVRGTGSGPAGDERERVLCRLVGEVLGVAHVGTEDSFFDLGGHSLLATRLIGRIRAELGAELKLRTLFEHPTVAGFAGRLTAARARPRLRRENEPENR
ncbi:amino acid adenylation domain-containing protein [Amycolatopsis sp. lyj-23]|uniref:amino acid adenylation domain-containing protein n=1 Tax=Amycolatopsis sp. lyj-23 TaxID=2789283 RepID=UPI0039784E67